MASPAHASESKHLLGIIDSIPSLIHTARPDGFLDYFNQHWLRYVGLALGDLLGWKWTAAIHPEDVEAIVNRWRSSVASGEPFLHEARVRRADGEYRWMLHHKVAVRDMAGDIVKWYGSSIDIEDRKRAEEAQQRTEFFLAEGQRLSHTGSWAFNPAGFDYWSPGLFELHGLERSGKAPTVEEYLALVHPEDRESVVQEIQKMLAHRSGFDFTKRIVRSDGKIRRVRCVGVPTTHEGAFQGFVGTAIDVTEQEEMTQELRRREAHLAAAQRLSRTGSFGWSVSNGEIFWSNETFRIFQSDASSKPTVEFVLSRVHPEDRDRVQQQFDRASRDAESFDFEHRLQMPDGSIKHVRVTAHPSRDSLGNLEFVGAVTDVSEQRRAEAVIREREGERTRIARELHDTLLQTCLSAMLQLGVAVESLPADTQSKSKLEAILQLMERGIEEGRSTIQGLRSADSSPSDLVVALSAVRQEFSPQPDVDFRISVVGQQQPLPSTIQQEVYRLGREALLNALCHSGAKRIDLELEYADSTLTMRVRDNGRGIEPQFLDTGREGHWGITGMRERAKRIGGLFKISSNANDGTEVLLSLPTDVTFEL